MNSQPLDQHMHHEDMNSPSITQEDKEDTLEAQSTCSGHCCSSYEKGFQPVDKPTLDMIATEKKELPTSMV